MVVAMKTIITCIFAGIIRLVCFNIEPFQQCVLEKNEVSTPLNSWKRVTEGIEIHRLSHRNFDFAASPYDGDVYHETPLALSFFRLMSTANISTVTIYLFIVCDVLTGFFLAWSANEVNKFLLQKQVRDVKLFTAESVTDLLRRENLINTPSYVLFMYLFNPFSIASCVAQTTTVFSNMFLALTFLFMMKGCHKLCMLCLAVVAYQTVYPLVLLAPAILHLSQSRRQGKLSVGVWSVFWFSVCSLSLLYMSRWIMSGSWSFLHSVYGFIFSVPDTSPNIGLFWYFFTEMFDHFRYFFLWIFQINAFIYVIPLTIRFKSDPPYLFILLLCQLTICRSYPSVADVALYMSMLPMYSFLGQYMRSQMVSFLLIVCSSVLGPIMYHLWIYNGSANANFYFAVTLAFNAGQVFLLSDLMTAHLRRSYYMKKGKVKGEDGKPVPIYLE